jgi:CRP/FNR family transcriptional regulator
MSSLTESEGAQCRISRDFEILRQTELFSGTPFEIVRLFAYMATHRSYHPGDPIFLRGDNADSACFILNGEVEISTAHREREVILQHLSTNTFFGELALLGKFRWYFTARAVTDVTLLLIDRQSFRKILEKYPEKRDTIIEKIVRTRISRFEQQTTYMLDRIGENSIEKKPVFI